MVVRAVLPVSACLVLAAGLVTVSGVVGSGAAVSGAAVSDAAVSGGGAAGLARFGAASVADAEPIQLSRVRGAAKVAVVQGLGDSVPAGSACKCTSFISLLAGLHGAVQHHAVAVSNVSRPGLDSAGLLAQVRAGALSAPPQSVTVVTIGANDFDSGVVSLKGCRANDGLGCYQTGLRALSQRVGALLRALAPVGQPRGPILVTGYWNVFLDGGVGDAMGRDYVHDSDALTRAVNAVLMQASRAYGAHFVDLYGPFNSRGPRETELLAADGDHPSAAGHALIARVLEKSLQDVLAHG